MAPSLWGDLWVSLGVSLQVSLGGEFAGEFTGEFAAIPQRCMISREVVYLRGECTGFCYDPFGE